MPDEITINPDERMGELLARLPGARRALFAAFHIGGCQSCAYKDEDTLAAVCRQHEIEVEQAVATLRASHEHDRKLLIAPRVLRERLDRGDPLLVVDVRTREEHEAVRLEPSVLLTQDRQQKLFGTPPEETIVLYDHLGRTVLDQCAWFHGHGLRNTLALDGGIDAWSQDVDPSVQRYRLEMD